MQASVLPTEDVWHLVLCEAELRLHGEDGEPHGVAAQHADHVTHTRQHRHHVPPRHHPH